MERLPQGWLISTANEGEISLRSRPGQGSRAGDKDKQGDWIANEVHIVESRTKGSIAGSLLGILTFLVGIALLALTFNLAITMFGVEPSKLFDLQPGKTLDISKAVTMLMGVVVKVLLLLVMAIVGGVVANRGVHLYADSRHASHHVVIRDTPPPGQERSDEKKEMTG